MNEKDALKKLQEIRNNGIKSIEKANEELNEILKESVITLDKVRKINKEFDIDLLKESDDIINGIFKDEKNFKNVFDYVNKELKRIMDKFNENDILKLYEIIFEKKIDISKMTPRKAQITLENAILECVKQITIPIAETMQIKMEAVLESLKKIEG
jgi:hypothetical protein